MVSLVIIKGSPLLKKGGIQDYSTKMGRSFPSKGEGGGKKPLSEGEKKKGEKKKGEEKGYLPAKEGGEVFFPGGGRKEGKLLSLKTQKKNPNDFPEERGGNAPLSKGIPLREEEKKSQLKKKEREKKCAFSCPRRKGSCREKRGYPPSTMWKLLFSGGDRRT